MEVDEDTVKHVGSYVGLASSGALAVRRDRAWERLHVCDLCAHECGVDRLAGKLGVCRSDETVQISNYGPHFGEERPLVGTRGSGTIFFAGCNLRCVFCQNWDISHMRFGRTVSPSELADIMLELEETGCHNINLVTPTHYMPHILSALVIAAEQGLELPIVYNCGGYESLEALSLLDGIVDIYMPDVKYSDPETGLRFSKARDYPDVVRASLKEMHRQVGDLMIDEDGIAWRGLLVRHLVLPERLAGTAEIVRFIAEELSPDTYINIMAQYRPEFRAREHPPLDRAITRGEYEEAIRLAREAGLHRFAE
ncbi:MAG: radical SAM protein [Firmicutes bacterium]|jgi:putative pyruvate formate lyase activating enzyme|nr:radical SAM protein [Bacillota bacterium]